MKHWPFTKSVVYPNGHLPPPPQSKNFCSHSFSWSHTDAGKRPEQPTIMLEIEWPQIDYVGKRPFVEMNICENKHFGKRPIVGCTLVILASSSSWLNLENSFHCLIKIFVCHCDKPLPFWYIKPRPRPLWFKLYLTGIPGSGYPSNKFTSGANLP